MYSKQKALQIANDLELDLVEISGKAIPPVCKVLEYKKFLYEQKKRDKVLKSKTTKVFIKEIRFGPQTDEHDYYLEKACRKIFKGWCETKGFVFLRKIYYF